MQSLVIKVYVHTKIRKFVLVIKVLYFIDVNCTQNMLMKKQPLIHFLLLGFHFWREIFKLKNGVKKERGYTCV